MEEENIEIENNEKEIKDEEESYNAEENELGIEEEPKVQEENIINETPQPFSQFQQTAPVSPVLKAEPIQPIQDLETDLQNTPETEQREENQIRYESDSRAYNTEPYPEPAQTSALVIEPRNPSLSFQPINQGFVKNQSAWNQAEMQNNAWHQAKVEDTSQMRALEEKKYEPFERDLEKRRRD